MSYDIALYIESEKIDESKIAGLINIRRNEGESALMDFTLITSSGYQDINAYTGKSVRIDVIADAGVYRLFTGTIDYPSLDLITKRIHFECSNNRKKLINDLDVSMIGSWSKYIFTQQETASEELDQRLKTTPYSLDFDVYGNHSVNDINPKSSPDFTLQGADIFYRNPSVSVVSSSEVINNVSLSFSYRYVRLRHRERRFQIGNDSFCDVSAGKGSYVNVQEALTNIEGSGWNVNEESIGYTYLPASGIYTCYGATFIWYNIDDPRTWVLSVFYDAAYRFAQTIVEDYTLTVKAPQSIDQFGEKDSYLTHSIDIDYDVSEWEKNTVYQSKDNLTEDSDWYVDEDGDIEEWEKAVKTALNIARTDILRSHRKNTVEFETPLFPTVELKHTVKVDSTQVVAKGKVTNIRHTIDINKRYGATALTLSFSNSQGGQSEDTITEPTRATVPVIGEDYSDYLIIDAGDDIVTPPIDDLARNTQTVEDTATYNIEIPDSPLTVTF